MISVAIDFVPDPPVQGRGRIRCMPATKLTVASEPRSIFIAFDHFRDEIQYGNVKGKNPLKDLRMRQAIAHAIDAPSKVVNMLHFYRFKVNP